MTTNSIFILINGESEFLTLQALLFKQGYKWAGTSVGYAELPEQAITYISLENGYIYYGINTDNCKVNSTYSSVEEYFDQHSGVLRIHVYAAIDSERDYQEKRWACQDGPDAGTNGHTVDEFSLYMLSYAQDLAKLASTTRGDGPKLDFVRKVTALGVACMEQHGAPLRETKS